MMHTIMSEMFILCRTSISYWEIKNREKLSLYKTKMEKDQKKKKGGGEEGERDLSFSILASLEYYCKIARLGYCL